MKTHNRLTRNRRIVSAVLLVFGLLASPFALPQDSAYAAACTMPATDYGSVTTSTTTSTAATFRVWTRMYIPDTTNNSYLLELDGNKCYTVGGGGVAAGSWVWVSHQNGSTSSKIDVALTQGSHAMKLIGNKPGVKVDKVVLTSDLNCVPTGFGDNCNAPSDSTAPSTQLTSPASGATVSGNINLAATVTDASGVSKAEFFVNGILLANDTSSPYSASWDSTKVANGSHSLSVRGYDVAGNMSTSSITVTVKNGDSQAPTTPKGLSATSLNAKTVRLKWSASSDSVGVDGYTLYRDGAPIATVSTSTLQYDDKSAVPNTTYKYKIDASDKAGNRSAQSATISITTPASTVTDTKAPSKPTALTAVAASASQVNLSWTKSDDNTGIAGYDIYRRVNDSFQKVGTTLASTYGDTSAVAGTKYTYYVVARDFSGNVSPKSETAIVTTPAAPAQLHRIHGMLRQTGEKPLPGAKLSYALGSVTHISQANRSGFYAIQNLQDDDYALTAYKHGYESNDVTIKLKGVDVEQAITLKKGK